LEGGEDRSQENASKSQRWLAVIAHWQKVPGSIGACDNDGVVSGLTVIVALVAVVHWDTFELSVCFFFDGCRFAM
jgi:hypothetical protein